MKQTAEDRPAGISPYAGSSHQPLLATLSLGFSKRADGTRLMRREHFGPLRVQKSLYPEGPKTCHAIIVHPPGGVVGGDELHIDAHIGPAAHALISTPGAAKWYRSNGRRATQRLQLRVDQSGALEWLPQETIIFDRADVLLDTTIHLHGDARYLGCEILCFGRTAYGERFTQGRMRQQLKILRDGRPIWLEQGTLAGGSRQMESPLALAGHTVCANLVAIGLPTSSAQMTALRDACTEAANGRGQFGATQMKAATIVRWLGDSSETAREVMLAAWRQLRPPLIQREAAPLRIWNT